MTEKICSLLEQLKARDYRKRRSPFDRSVLKSNTKNGDYFTYDFRLLAEAETPFFLKDDSLGFHRSTAVMVHNHDGNYTLNYARMINEGFDAVCGRIRASMEQTADESKLSCGREMLECMDISYGVAQRYRDAAKANGNLPLYEALCKIPAKKAETFYEACVFLNLLIYLLRLSGGSHLTLGRFDQYMYPFYLHDRERGVSKEELFEVLEEFFLSINFDTDLYHGVQVGDNGQSMVLGGYDKDGKDMYNELSELCMNASLELKLIDPKINLRVNSTTPMERYRFATLLTREGLGFPQYCNDDVVVKGLTDLGYDYEDALNYTVAACWEYIIPNCGADVRNLATMNFPLVVSNVITEKLESCADFDALMEEVKKGIADECDRIVTKHYGQSFCKNPMMSILTDGCIEALQDARDGGAKYRCFGSHGAGIANATDALAAVRKVIYQEKTVSKATLLDALKKDFAGYTELQNTLRNCPKMGNNDDETDEISCVLMEAFSSHLNRRKNGIGGFWRAGTGSAMDYISEGKKCPATADGRNAGEPFSSSFSPALDARTDGLLSVIQSFTKYDLSKIINGGPLTIEVHDTVLNNDIGIEKTAMLVREFVLLGGHQLQINAINRDRLLDAQKHPENYPNLIVRVWGWSGYFNELDQEYQNHIIRRTEFVV